MQTAAWQSSSLVCPEHLSAIWRDCQQKFYSMLFYSWTYVLYSSFRQVNRRSRQAVDILPEYQAVATHGLNVFCALMRTRLGYYVTLWKFYIVLCTERSCSCTGFGTFVFLPAFQRYCFRCIQNSPATEMIPFVTLRKSLDLSRQSLARLRHFKTLPGIYTME